MGIWKIWNSSTIIVGVSGDFNLFWKCVRVKVWWWRATLCDRALIIIAWSFAKVLQHGYSLNKLIDSKNLSLMSCNFNNVITLTNFCFAALILNLPIQLLSVNTNAAGKIGQFLWRMTSAIFSQNVSWVTLGGNHFSLDYKPENLDFSYFEFFFVSFTKSYVHVRL